MLKYILIFLFIGFSFAEDQDGQYVLTCPMVTMCTPSNSSKQNKAFAKINQEAYDCYRYIGETDLAESAAIATTKCLAIYGSSTATTLKTITDPK